MRHHEYETDQARGGEGTAQRDGMNSGELNDEGLMAATIRV